MFTPRGRYETSSRRGNQLLCITKIIIINRAVDDLPQCYYYI